MMRAFFLHLALIAAAPIAAAADAVTTTQGILEKRSIAAPWIYDGEAFAPGRPGLPAYSRPPRLVAGVPGASLYDPRHQLAYAMARGDKDYIYELDPRTGRWRIVAEGGSARLRGIALDGGMDGLLTGFVKSADHLGLRRINPRTGMSIELRYPRSLFTGLPDTEETRLHVLGSSGTAVAVLLETPPHTPRIYLIEIARRKVTFVGTYE